MSNIKAMFINDSAYAIFIIDPKISIPHAATFFENPQLPASGILHKQTFTSGHDAYRALKEMLDNAKNKYIEQGNTKFNMYAVVLSKSPSGKPVVQGLIETEVNNSNTNYFVANNSHPKELIKMNDENEMCN